MKWFFNLFLVLFMFVSALGCTSFGDREPDYEKIADKITNRTAEKLKEEKKLILIGIGGRMMDDIQMMAMSFNYYHEVNLEQARKLIVYAIDEYLSDINNNQKIRPYLHEYPFTVKNVEIAIFFRNPDGSNVAAETINVAAANQGRLIYYVDCPEKHTIKAIYRETYEEAKEAISSK